MAKSDIEQVIDMVFALLPNGVATATGERETQVYAKPPRVVAVPRGAPEIVEPDRHGDARYSDKGRILYRRWFNIEWFCHGADAEGITAFGAAEALFKTTLKAIREIAHNSVRFSDELWEDQQTNSDGYERFGTVIRFTSALDIPIYEDRSLIVTLTATPPIVTTATLNDQEE